MNHKVFCLGFPKTGTSSIGFALHLLGYHVTGPAGSAVDRESISSREQAIHMIRDNIKKYEAFQDSPYPYLYEYIDRKTDGQAKYILTVRDEEDWFRSTKKYFGNNSTPLREWIYGSGKGCPVGNKKHI